MDKEYEPLLLFENDQQFLKVIWSNNHISRFYCKYIRFNCHCDGCMRPIAGRYVTDIRNKFDNKFAFTNAQILDNCLVARFNGDDAENHETTIPMQWLRCHCNCKECLNKELDRREISSFSIPSKVDIPFMKSQDVQTKEGRFRCIENVLKVGFCLIENVPRKDQEVKRFAKQFGFIINTAYGTMFDIKVQSNPYNTAHTTVPQNLHQDQITYECQPGVQYLHAYRFDEEVTGGESIIVDLFMAANKLKTDSPKLFDALTRIPACFYLKHYKRDEPVFKQSMKPHIELDYHKRIVAIHWDPGNEGVLRVQEDDVKVYYEAHSAFLNILNSEECQFVFRMKPGQLLMLNNRRVVHARNGFALNGGVRHLQGVYTGIDDLKSTYVTLGNELGIDVVPIKVGNRSSF